MSGGVDSSVAALLLVEQGFDVVGVTMCLGVEREGRSSCCGKEAIEDAAQVARTLDIPHYVLDFSRELEELVIADFVEQYRRGRTPNPCVVCNRSLKFGKLLDYALASGFDCLATGHYACLVEEGGRFLLRRPRDRRKDQTYFLYAIPSDRFSSLLFPLAHLTKDEVRSLALRAGLHVAEKAQSQDICFLPWGDYRSFLSKRLSSSSGPIVDVTGRVLGKHRGYFRYTIGQRKGLGLASPHPLYVLAIRPERNEIVVGERASLRVRGLLASSCNWLVEELPESIFAQVRYLQRKRPCEVERDETGKMKVIFHEPVEMVAPGQSVVLYSDDTVLGGGVIEEVLV